MAITTTNPVSDPSGNFDKLTVTLAISPIVTPNYIGASVACRFRPYRENADGTIELSSQENERVISLGDAYEHAQSDPVLANCIGTILYALQEFVTSKGL